MADQLFAIHTGINKYLFPVNALSKLKQSMFHMILNPRNLKLWQFFAISQELNNIPPQFMCL